MPRCSVCAAALTNDVRVAQPSQPELISDGWLSQQQQQQHDSQPGGAAEEELSLWHVGLLPAESHTDAAGSQPAANSGGGGAAGALEGLAGRRARQLYRELVLGLNAEAVGLIHSDQPELGLERLQEAKTALETEGARLAKDGLGPVEPALQKELQFVTYCNLGMLCTRVDRGLSFERANDLAEPACTPHEQERWRLAEQWLRRCVPPGIRINMPACVFCTELAQPDFEFRGGAGRWVVRSGRPTAAAASRWPAPRPSTRLRCRDWPSLRSQCRSGRRRRPGWRWRRSGWPAGARCSSRSPAGWRPSSSRSPGCWGEPAGSSRPGGWSRLPRWPRTTAAGRVRRQVLR